MKNRGRTRFYQCTNHVLWLFSFGIVFLVIHIILVLATGYARDLLRLYRGKAILWHACPARITSRNTTTRRVWVSTKHGGHYENRTTYHAHYIVLHHYEHGRKKARVTTHKKSSGGGRARALFKKHQQWEKQNGGQRALARRRGEPGVGSDHCEFTVWVDERGQVHHKAVGTGTYICVNLLALIL